MGKIKGLLPLRERKVGKGQGSDERIEGEKEGMGGIAAGGSCSKVLGEGIDTPVISR